MTSSLLCDPRRTMLRVMSRSCTARRMWSRAWFVYAMRSTGLCVSEFPVHTHSKVTDPALLAKRSRSSSTPVNVCQDQLQSMMCGQAYLSSAWRALHQRQLPGHDVYHRIRLTALSASLLWRGVQGVVKKNTHLGSSFPSSARRIRAIWTESTSRGSIVKASIAAPGCFSSVPNFHRNPASSE